MSDTKKGRARTKEMHKEEEEEDGVFFLRTHARKGGGGDLFLLKCKAVSVLLEMMLAGERRSCQC